MFLTIFVKNCSFLGRKKILTNFFVEITKKGKKLLYQMKVGIKLVKVKKFGNVWCIPHRMAAKNAPPGLIGLKLFMIDG